MQKKQGFAFSHVLMRSGEMELSEAGDEILKNIKKSKCFRKTIFFDEKN